MKPEIKEDILRVLNESIQSLNKGEFLHLKELSNTVIHNASIFQDEDSVSIAVIIYALSKVFERLGSKSNAKIVPLLKNLKFFLEKEYYDDYKRELRKTVVEINNIDQKIKLYIQEVIRQAEIKKATKIYDHGISVARTAELLNISQWELLNFVGVTQIPDRFDESSDVKYRIRFARKLFGVKGE